MQNLTETIYIKHGFTDKELLDLSRKMANAEATIGEKEDELKSIATMIKADIAASEATVNSCAEKIRSGYEMRKKECNLKYDKDLVVYVDKETGEILESRPMTQTEQLKLSGKWVDAEQVIRADNEKGEKDNA